MDVELLEVFLGLKSFCISSLNGESDIGLLLSRIAFTRHIKIKKLLEVLYGQTSFCRYFADRGADIRFMWM